MRSRRKRVRLALIAAVVLTAAALGIVAYEKGTLRWVELNTIDTRFDVRGKHPAPRGVAVVAIDTRTFNELYWLNWPYPRRYHAQAIKILKAAGARVIAYDVQFTQPT